MSFPLLVILAGIISIMGLIVYQMFNAGKKRQRHKNETRAAHGFHLVDLPEAELVQRLISLHQKREHQRLGIKDLAVRNESDFRFYTYDILDTSGNDSHRHEEWVLAILSPYLKLPRFTLIPKIDMPGKLASLANHFLEKLTVKHAHKINFDSHEQFSRRYMVTGNNDEDIRRLFNEQVLNHLSNTIFWLVEGDGDLLTFSRFQFNRQGNKNRMENLGEKINEGRSLFNMMVQASQSLSKHLQRHLTD